MNENFVEKWYVLHTYSGHEYRVKDLLTERVVSLGVKDKVLEILVPDEEKIEIKGAKRRIVKKKAFPGYVLVRIMVEPYQSKTGTEYRMDNNVWYVVRNTDGVSGFVGTKNVPTPISDDEVAVIQGRMKRYSSAPKEELQFNVGDKVEIISGSFMGSFGKIESIDMQHSKLTVMVEIFNRLTPVEVNFDEIHSI
ncbi:MAG TPA: transcription termination/antitermination factor NusG [Fusobacteria bacterium]|nr:transcription termination/antitermination factor NusG [Fusobacteriota bacterium]|tara:strand:+ start:5443 stop:6024 length:582 start_codon:yes stop_codon:yes gene_type:complete